MEASTSAPNNTGSKTIADMIGLAADKFGDQVDGAVQDRRRVARRHLRRGRRHRQRDRARPDRPGRRPRRPRLHPGQHAARSGPTPTSGITSTGAVVVPIYQTNSPEECEWVVGNSEAVAVICEDAAQLAKIDEVRERLPQLQHVIVMDDAGVDRATPSASTTCASAAAAATRRSCASAQRPSPRTTRSRSSTRRGPPGRRRAASSPTATTARSSTCARRSTSSTRATSPTCSCRWPTPSRC